MALYQVLFDKWQQARLQRIELEATALNTYVSDVQMIGKNAGRDVTDEDVIQVLKKHEKGVIETLKALKEADHRIPRYKMELALIGELLPRQLTQAETLKIIADNAFLTIKDAMAYFKFHYAGRFDGKLVSGAFR